HKPAAHFSLDPPEKRPPVVVTSPPGTEGQSPPRMLMAAPYICGQPAANTNGVGFLDVSKKPMAHGFHAKSS
ncbi:MAG: hypothetical protein WBF49_01365, partial [Methyloceanibacter sp.]